MNNKKLILPNIIATDTIKNLSLGEVLTQVKSLSSV